MSDIATRQPTHETIARKTVQGAFSLGIRQILVQGARIGAGVVLARLLTPAEFGVYAIILYLQTFLVTFGDAGLAGSLIRQQGEPEIEDYQAVFTVQQILVLAVTVVLWSFSGWIAFRYHLPSNYVWLFRLVALSFLATSFMVIPQVRLERRLEFHKVALVDSVQAIVFNGLTVYLAWAGLGAFSFAWALVIRAIVGAGLVNWLSPWNIGWHWDWARIKQHLAFGIPYQGIQTASLLKDSITPILIGLFLGTSEVGYITWAAMVAAYPVLALMVLQRVYMPAFASLQEHRGRLKSLIENVIWATNAIAAPLSIITLVLIHPITTLIYGSKWSIAIPYFYFFWLANIFVPTATPSLSLLNAMGKSKTAFWFATVWMAGTWIIGAPLIYFYGGIGFAIANLGVQFSNLWLYRSAQREIAFNIYSVILPVWVLALCSGLLLYLCCKLYMPVGPFALTCYSIFTMLMYVALAGIYYRRTLGEKWKSLRRMN